MGTTARKKRMTKAERRLKEDKEFMDKLRGTPPEKLSPIARYWLEHEHDAPVVLNMRYVLR